MTENDDVGQTAARLIERIANNAKSSEAPGRRQESGLRIVINRAEHCTFILGGEPSRTHPPQSES